MKPVKKKYDSAKVEENILYNAKIICAIDKINISDYISEAVEEKNKKHGTKRITGSKGR